MRVLAYDLDNTLVDAMGHNLPAVAQINAEFEDPACFIVVYTARSYSTFHDTRALLLRNGIKHHALVCEKIRATQYIDDKARTP